MSSFPNLIRQIVIFHSCAAAAPKRVGVVSSRRAENDFTWGRRRQENVMRTKVIFHTILFLAIASGLSSARALTREEVVAKIQAAGYTQVSDIKSTAEGTTAKAVKNGKDVRLVVDSAGQIKEQK
ncbi:hypothetical protein ABH991_006458 [Bradyrhizobium ottawaense]|jgi:hypothetical protein|uniref:PepSY domain-containing protein n=2 Tax=Nitrobacteraceae TaxID=41294 RepID=A0ABV4FXZ3_9BRAD